MPVGPMAKERAAKKNLNQRKKNLGFVEAKTGVSPGTKPHQSHLVLVLPAYCCCRACGDANQDVPEVAC